MATITFRLEDGERDMLARQARERGVPLSVVVREALGVRRDPVCELQARVDELDRRLADNGIRVGG